MSFIGHPFFVCINKCMGTLKNSNKKMFNISPSIIVNMDENNMGEMYVYDKSPNGLILNGMTAKQLIDYFAYHDNMELSNEILDIIMNVNINVGTH